MAAIFDIFLPFLQVLLIDISLAGDNAIAVGMAASGLPAVQRNQAVLAGIAAATILRIIFAIFAVQLLHVTGLLTAGGLLLIWVSWKMYRDLRSSAEQGQPDDAAHQPAKTLRAAITQIVVADVSMSLDNVLGVAGVARENMWILVAGLTVSVVLMGAAATFVARLTTRFPWIAYLGLVVVFYTACDMIWQDKHTIMHFLVMLVDGVSEAILAVLSFFSKQA